jgi:hypothetical protein
MADDWCQDEATELLARLRQQQEKRYSLEHPYVARDKLLLCVSVIGSTVWMFDPTNSAYSEICTIILREMNMEIARIEERLSDMGIGESTNPSIEQIMGLSPAKREKYLASCKETAHG